MHFGKYFLKLLKIIIMKAFILIFSILLFNNTYSFEINSNQDDLPRAEMQYIPDVMNKIQVLEFDGKNHSGHTLDGGSLPVFNNFPRSASRESLEGGIFCNMDFDSDLEIVYGIGQTIQAWNIDGTDVPGWPVTLSYEVQGAPAFGDIDGDGTDELVVATSNYSNEGIIYAFEKDGTPVAGFPINNGATQSSIVLADLNNDGAMEIITNKRIYPIGEIWVYKGDGTVYPGWPKTLDHVPASSSAVGDITGDGIPEIISESYISVYAWDRNGNEVPGFPFHMPDGNVNSYSSPVLADVDGDNIREIIFGTHNIITGKGNVYILKNNGTVFHGWPNQTNWWTYGPPVLGYINDDNVLDIVVGEQQTFSYDPLSYIHGWDIDGNVLAGFPIGPLYNINNQVTLADIDNDDRLELIVDDNTQNASGLGKYLTFNHDGTPVSGWTIPTAGTTFFNMPCIADLNNDGKIDLVGAGYLVGGSYKTFVYIWDTGVNYNPSRIVNPVWQFNVRHNGVYGDNDVISVQNINSVIPAEFVLHQNYPNPFNPVTKIRFDVAAKLLNQTGNVRLSIYNALGKEITTLVNENLNPGSYEVEFNAGTFPSGVYFYKLETGKFSDVKKMFLIK